MNTGRHHHRRGHRDGVTLLELMVVLVVMAIMASVVMFAAPRGRQVFVDSASASVAAARQRALMSGRPISITIRALSKGVPAWLAWERHASSQALLAASDAAVADATTRGYGVTRDSLRGRLKRLAALDSALVPGGDPGAAAASLATMVSDASTDAGVTIGSLQPVVDSPPRSLGTRRTASEAPFASVSVHGDATGDVVGLMQFLADLEHGPTLLAVRDLTIAQPDPLASSDRMEILHAKFTVGGFARRTPSQNGGRDSSWQTQMPASHVPIPSR